MMDIKISFARFGIVIKPAVIDDAFIPSVNPFAEILNFLNSVPSIDTHSLKIDSPNDQIELLNV
jgi:hypothetical protein